MWRRGFVVGLVAVAGCNIPAVAFTEITPAARIGGQVRGLWDGADGVALRLQADGVDTLLAVSANGAFLFEDQLAPRTSYTVTVTTNPVQHTCIVDSGGTGVVADTDVMNVSIACTGPAAMIVLSGPWGWTFDPTQEIQTFSGSVAFQDITLMVHGSSLSSATVNGSPVVFDKAIAPIPLQLGSTTLPVALTASGGLSKTYQLIFERGASVVEQMAYGKASNTSGRENFGIAMSLSGDTLAIGADTESSMSNGINGDQTQRHGGTVGAVYVFVRNGPSWAQQAYLKASNVTTAAAVGRFGISVSLSGDTLAVGADGENSAATGVNGDQTSRAAGASGAVYVFVRNGTSWAQQAYIKASNTRAMANFGGAVALFGDTLAVGSIAETSATTGIDGDQTDDTTPSAGAVYVFARTAATWRQQAYVKASNTQRSGQFGSAIALFGDTLAVGSPGESSAAQGIDGNQADTSAHIAGAVYIFARTGATWRQQAYVKASNTRSGAHFGRSVALFGGILAVGSPSESSAATGVDGDQTDNTANESGAVYVFHRDNEIWKQQTYLKASNTGAGDQFGYSMSVYGDSLVIGAINESSAATGIAGDQTNNDAPSSGAAYLFTHNGTQWTQQAYLKASNTNRSSQFGASISLFDDTLAVGAYLEASPSTGINGDQTNDAGDSGAIYVFR